MSGFIPPLSVSYHGARRETLTFSLLLALISFDFCPFFRIAFL
jgi:hypothetical protein